MHCIKAYDTRRAGLNHILTIGFEKLLLGLVYVPLCISNTDLENPGHLLLTLMTSSVSCRVAGIVVIMHPNSSGRIVGVLVKAASNRKYHHIEQMVHRVIWHFLLCLCLSHTFCS